MTIAERYVAQSGGSGRAHLFYELGTASLLDELEKIVILDETGLISAAMEAGLPPELQRQLVMAREQFAEGRPDGE